MRVFKSEPSGGKKTGDMCIVIRPQYDTLQEDLNKTFAGHKDVSIIVDRRKSERRRKQEPVSLERRKADRRKERLDVAEVVIFA